MKYNHDKVYWIIYNRIKAKYPDRSTAQLHKMTSITYSKKR